ncbi:hypothetical protein KU43P_01450 [Pseudomonas sp. KU43P]|nr:hypothetical protein KU43P_01450 [Pseudomonas sp. KU43P]
MTFTPSNRLQGAVNMAFDAYIQIAEIPGEAKDEQYTHWIEILGYTFGTS